MFRTLVLAALLVGCLGAAPRVIRKPRLDGRIVGGRDTDISNYPHQLSYEYYGSHICGASIISSDWAVTAAHCADGMDSSAISMRAGTSVVGDGGSVHPAVSVLVHEQFDYYILDYDVAVVKVSPAFPNSEKSRPIALTTSAPSAGMVLTVTGWGATSEGGGSPSQLQEVQVPAIAHDECNDDYKDYGGITDRMVCAGLTTGGKDACQGDSGGPLIYGDTLMGIVSWGVGCAREGYPGVYSNVAELRQWILSNTDN